MKPTNSTIIVGIKLSQGSLNVIPRDQFLLLSNFVIQAYLFFIVCSMYEEHISSNNACDKGEH